MDALGNVPGLRVEPEGARVEGREILGRAPLAQQILEIAVRVAADLALRLRRGARQERPVRVHPRIRLDPLPLDEGRHDVEEGEALDPARRVEGQTVGDAPAAIMTGEPEADMAEPLHHRDDLGPDLGLGVSRPTLRVGGGRPAVALEVEGDHPVRPRQGGGQPVPHRVALGKAVQQQERCCVLPAPGPGEPAPGRAIDPERFEAGKQVVAVRHRQGPRRASKGR